MVYRYENSLFNNSVAVLHNVTNVALMIHHFKRHGHTDEKHDYVMVICGIAHNKDNNKQNKDVY